MTTRRDFLRTTAGVGAAFIAGGCGSAGAAAPGRSSASFKPIKFGLIADIHKNHMPFGDKRMEAFIGKVETEKPDFILSLGDFCYPLKENEAFAKRFAEAPAPSYHVLGNHEMDTCSKSEIVDFLGMPSPYYSVDVGGYHLVVLDANFIYTDGKFVDYDKKNYAKFGGRSSYVNDEQCEWLKADLEKTNLPTFVFSHQSLLHDNGGIPNRAYIQSILESANEKAVRDGKRPKVLGCFNGHNHRDYYRRMSGIHYFSLNSVAYFYPGIRTPNLFPDPDDYGKYPVLDRLAPYKDPLFCFIEIDSKGTLNLRGAKTEWVGPGPVMETSPSVAFSQGEVAPKISDRKVELG